MAGAYPDVVIGCVGGGRTSPAWPSRSCRTRSRAATCASSPWSLPRAPTLTRGTYGYDFGDTAQMTPLAAHALPGPRFIPPSIHSGGLRYHGMAPLVSHVVHEGLVEATSTRRWSASPRPCGLPAPRASSGAEPSHAIRHVVTEVERAREEGVEKTILFNLCGHGHFDMAAYADFLSGNMTDLDVDEASWPAPPRPWRPCPGSPSRGCLRHGDSPSPGDCPRVGYSTLGVESPSFSSAWASSAAFFAALLPSATRRSRAAGDHEIWQAEQQAVLAEEQQEHHAAHDEDQAQHPGEEHPLAVFTPRLPRSGPRWHPRCGGRARPSRRRPPS